MATGFDHLCCLDGKGQVFCMGDDSYGQCGNPAVKGRAEEHRVGYPVLIKGLPKVTSIACGGDHVLAIDESGAVFGWGSNSSMQLSQEHEFSRPDLPLLAHGNPVRLSKKIENLVAERVAAGASFSVIAGRDRVTG